MLDRLPLPTDNIYKFYALLGLILLIFTSGALVYSNKQTNDFLFEAIIEREVLNEIESPKDSELAQILVFDRKIEIAQSDRGFRRTVFGSMGAVAFYLMFFGFRKWNRKIQPQQDKLLELTIERLSLEIEEKKGNG